MSQPERVVESLNRALHSLFASDDRVLLIGEDLLDPYGGAFKVAKGLSTKYPDRVLTTPLSEEGFVGVACGLALCGDKPIVEIMFGDFIALAFDQILNVASKSVSMYGRAVPMNLVVRSTVGGNRAYGPTHSQCLQKHFIGIPNLELWELSPLHDPTPLLEKLTSLGRPAILFEDKILYTQRVYRHGRIDDLLRYEPIGGGQDFVRVFSPEWQRPGCTLIAAGGLVGRAVEAIRRLFIDHELGCDLYVPSRLYPLDLEPILPRLRQAGRVIVAEEGVGGGTWGAEIAQQLHTHLWGELQRPVALVSSKESIIPSAAHLEREVLVQAESLFRALREVAGA